MEKRTAFHRKVSHVKKSIATTDSSRMQIKTTVTAREDNKRRSLGCKFMKRVKNYYDGKPRPLCRGLLHGIVFCMVCVALPVLMLGI